jgi:lipopolysaccharide biosynthesis regulator YciM
MNPLIEQQLKQIRALVEDLGGLLRETQQQLEEKQKAYLKLTQEYWSRGSKIAVLDRNEEEYQVLLEENDRFKKQKKELRERLERVLSCTKALQAEFHK